VRLCKGARFNSETLEVALRDKTIDDVLNMSIEEGMSFFANEPAVRKKIQVLADLGLGYLTLGQSATTLAGGEAQRIKIATELSTLQRSKHTLYILDEPTTGLHLADVERLLASLNRLVDGQVPQGASARVTLPLAAARGLSAHDQRPRTGVPFTNSRG
jgi:excinuclease ABC subunit A